MAMSSSSSISGLVRRSKAPARMASMAVSDGAVAGDQDHDQAGMLLAAHGPAGRSRRRRPGGCRPAPGRRSSCPSAAVAVARLLADVELIALAAEPIGHRLEHLAIVVDQQQRTLIHTSPDSISRRRKGVRRDLAQISLDAQGRSGTTRTTRHKHHTASAPWGEWRTDVYPGWGEVSSNIYVTRCP